MAVFYKYEYMEITKIIHPCPIYISGSLFSVFWLNSREECQLSLHVHNT